MLTEMFFGKPKKNPFETFNVQIVLTDNLAQAFWLEWNLFKSRFFPQSFSPVYGYTSSRVLSPAQTLINSVALRSEWGGAGEDLNTPMTIISQTKASG